MTSSTKICQLDGMDDSLSEDDSLEEGIEIKQTANSLKCSELVTSLKICQLDGNNDISSSRDSQDIRTIYAINCETREIINLMNLFRSFNLLWSSSQWHSLCEMEKGCFYCHMRSSCVRIHQEREKGPKSLKVNEFTTQLYHFGSNWR